MSRSRATLGLVLALALSTLSVACSDDDDSAEPDTTPPITGATTAPGGPTDTGSTTTVLDASAVETSDEFCAAAQGLVDLDAATTPLMNTILEAVDQPPTSDEAALADAIAQLEALEPEIVDAYDALAGTAPPELAAGVADFRAGSLAVLDAVREAADTLDVESAMAGLDQEVARRAVEGARLVSGVTQENCGFSITD